MGLIKQADPETQVPPPSAVPHTESDDTFHPDCFCLLWLVVHDFIKLLAHERYDPNMATGPARLGFFFLTPRAQPFLTPPPVYGS
jgi:hypothetical protein